MIDKVGRFCLPIKSANKNLSSVMQKLADFVVQHRMRTILHDKISEVFGYWSTDFVYVLAVILYCGRRIFILVIYFVNLFVTL